MHLCQSQLVSTYAVQRQQRQEVRTGPTDTGSPSPCLSRDRPSRLSAAPRPRPRRARRSVCESDRQRSMPLESRSDQVRPHLPDFRHMRNAADPTLLSRADQVRPHLPDFRRTRSAADPTSSPARTHPCPPKMANYRRNRSTAFGAAPLASPHSSSCVGRSIRLLQQRARSLRQHLIMPRKFSAQRCRKSSILPMS